MAHLTCRPLAVGKHLSVQSDLQRMNSFCELMGCFGKKPDHTLQNFMVGSKVQEMETTTRENSKAITDDVN